MLLKAPHPQAGRRLVQAFERLLKLKPQLQIPMSQRSILAWDN